MSHLLLWKHKVSIPPKSGKSTHQCEGLHAIKSHHCRITSGLKSYSQILLRPVYQMITAFTNSARSLPPGEFKKKCNSGVMRQRLLKGVALQKCSVWQGESEYTKGLTYHHSVLHECQQHNDERLLVELWQSLDAHSWPIGKVSRWEKLHYNKGLFSIGFFGAVVSASVKPSIHPFTIPAVVYLPVKFCKCSTPAWL